MACANRIPGEGKSSASIAANSKQQQGMGSEKFTKQNGVQHETGTLPFKNDISCLLQSCLQAVMIPALRWSKTHPSDLTVVICVESFSNCPRMSWCETLPAASPGEDVWMQLNWRWGQTCFATAVCLLCFPTSETTVLPLLFSGCKPVTSRITSSKL